MATHRENRNRKVKIREAYKLGVPIDQICGNFNITYTYFTNCLFKSELTLLKAQNKIENKKVSAEEHPNADSKELLQTKRLQEIIQMASEGKTLEEVGAEFNLSRERIRQILTKEGHSIRDFKTRNLKNQELLKAEINDWVEVHPGCRVEEIENHFKIERRQINILLTSVARRLLLSTEPVTNARRTRKFSEDDVLNALRDAVKSRNPMMGLYAHRERIPLTGPYYEKLRVAGQIYGPSEARIIQIFGTWRNACERAGIESKASVRTSYVSTWTEDELITTVADFLVKSKRSSAREFDDWCKLEVSRPSFGTIKNKFETWENAKTTALLKLRKTWDPLTVLEN